MNLTIHNWENLDSLSRYDQLIGLSEAIQYLNQRIDRASILDLLDKIESVRFALAHNKGTESNSARLDRSLAFAALSLAKMVYSGVELKPYIDRVTYYENSAEIKAIYLSLLNG